MSNEARNENLDKCVTEHEVQERQTLHHQLDRFMIFEEDFTWQTTIANSGKETRHLRMDIY